MPGHGLGSSSSRQITRQGGLRHGSQRQRQRERTGAPRRRRGRRPRRPNVDASDSERARREAVVDPIAHSINSISARASGHHQLSFRGFGFENDGTSSDRGDSEEFEDVNLDYESSSIGEEESEEEVDDIIEPNRNQFDAFMIEGSSDESESEAENDMESVALSESDQTNLESTASLEENSFEGRESKIQCDDDDDDGIVRCAICFHKDDQSHNWRRLMHLPCCGGNGKETTSTTRFCAACLLQLSRRAAVELISRGVTTGRQGLFPTFPSDEYPVHPTQYRKLPMPERIFYRDDCQTEKRRFIECPRCKDILVVDIKKKQGRLRPYDHDDGDWTDPKNADSISLQKPTFKGRCRYAGKKVGTARILLRAALLNNNLIPVEALMATEAEVGRLLRWRLLERVPRKDTGDIFMMKKEDHSKLIDLLGIDSWTAKDFPGVSGEEFISLYSGFLDSMHIASLNHLKAFRLETALRLSSRRFYYCRRNLGPILPCSEAKELVVIVIFLSPLAMMGVVAYAITMPFFCLACSAWAFAFATIWKFGHVCLLLVHTVWEFILSISLTTIAFGIVCGVLGFLCGQRHATLNLSDIMQHSTQTSRVRSW